MEHEINEWQEYRRLVLMSLEENEQDIKDVKEKLHSLELKVNTLETKLWAAIAIVGFISTIIAPICTSMIINYIASQK